MHIRWLGEKYDGIRCIWNPQQQKLYLFVFSFFINLFFDAGKYNKTGIELSLPTNLVRQCNITNTFLDGEIWSGRGLYIEAQRILTSYHINWQYIR